jgi:8-amino-7-oxononanoate synthase
MTPGVPAALDSPPIAAAIAGALATLTGTERALLFRSTLHAFWDVFGSLARDTSTIHIDAGAYPIARWGAVRAAARGVRVRSFAHRDPGALRRQLRESTADRTRRPLVVADGLCPGCGGMTPIGELLESLRPLDGRLVLDDTQALGILGESAQTGAPYGTGGGGSLRWTGVTDPNVVLVSSLAKGFGAPLAIIGGSGSIVAGLEAESETRAHCSPPSFADLHAAERAVRLNRTEGDRRRWRLAALIRRFRRGLARLGLSAGRSLFPVQSLDPVSGLSPAALSEALRRRGIRAVLHKPECRRVVVVSFVLTASHSPGAIDHALEALGRIVAAATTSGPRASRAI